MHINNLREYQQAVKDLILDEVNYLKEVIWREAACGESVVELKKPFFPDYAIGKSDHAYLLDTHNKKYVQDRILIDLENEGFFYYAAKNGMLGIKFDQAAKGSFAWRCKLKSLKMTISDFLINDLKEAVTKNHNLRVFSFLHYNLSEAELSEVESVLSKFGYTLSIKRDKEGKLSQACVSW